MGGEGGYGGVRPKDIHGVSEPLNCGALSAAKAERFSRPFCQVLVARGASEARSVLATRRRFRCDAIRNVEKPAAHFPPDNAVIDKLCDRSSQPAALLPR